jgi:hypothetical protein
MHHFARADLRARWAAFLPLAQRLWPLGLCAALVLITLFIATPGYLTWDSGTYHLMVRSLYRTGAFIIQNDYEELASPLLAVGQTMVKNGRLVSQYPELYTVLTLPFYAAFGFRGLMVLNTLAFAGTCCLIWRMAGWFSTEKGAPLAAVVVYATATYALEFTHSSYPHLTSTFLICAAVWLVWGAALEQAEPASAQHGWLFFTDKRCALAGFIFAIAVGVRLDSAFAILALSAPLVISPRLGWRAVIACAIGALPVVLLLTWINWLKFGEPLPFSYGREGGGKTGSVLAYLPVAAVFAAGLVFIALHRNGRLRLSRGQLALGILGLGIAFMLMPVGQRLAFGMFQLVVDMRLRPEIPEPALSRSAGGAVVYWSNVKKSLLQSCPYLILIALPALRGLCGGTYGTRSWLWLVPAGFIGFYGYHAWHGSVGWNMRYLNPALPFLAILASHELLRLSQHLPLKRASFWVGIAVVWIALAAMFMSTWGKPLRQEQLILNGSLILAALLLFLQLLEWVGPPRCRAALSGALALNLTWAFALTISVDYLLGRAVRQHFLTAAQMLEQHIEPRALIISFQPDYVWGLLDSRKEPVIANFNLGTPEDAGALSEAALMHRPVYWLRRSAGDDRSRAMAAEFQARAIRVGHVVSSASHNLELLKLTKHRSAAAP